MPKDIIDQSAKISTEKAIEEQHINNKLTARERIEAILDKNSFVETNGSICNIDAGEKVTNAISGYGTIDRRLVYIFAQDHTINKGLFNKEQGRKLQNALSQALKAGVPLITVFDSDGLQTEAGIEVLSSFGEIYNSFVMASGVIPLISMIMGPCLGHAAILAGLSDFVFAVEGSALSSPDCRGTASATYTNEGSIVHFLAGDEPSCIAQLRSLLAFLPSNNLEGVPVYECTDSQTRCDGLLADMAESGPGDTDIRKVICAIADNHDFMEIQASSSDDLVYGFMRLNGITTGAIANQSASEKILNGSAARSAARFVNFCDAFSIPLLTLVDCRDAAAQDYRDTISMGQLVFTYANATVPKIALICGDAFGKAYNLLGAKSLGTDAVIAWNCSAMAVMPTADRENIHLQEAAAKGYIDLLIEPAQSRLYLIRFLDALLTKKESRPAKKHDNMPL